jgi:ATP-dependent exoDNAse (exonuclease V) beta subunit
VRAQAGFALRKGGERVLANVYRLIELARRYETNGATSFRSFVEYLEEEAVGSEAAEAPVLERKSGGVTLMTAHKAKGLEFPVVILADMNSSLVRSGGGDRYVDSARGVAAQRLLSWAPHELRDNAALEEQRETEEAWRVAYVAATRARDLLVVTATGDEIKENSWLSPLYPALYPRRGQWAHPRVARGCEFPGKDTVLQRPVDIEPEEILRPGEHDANLGSHRVVWFDPTLIANSPETDAGISDDTLLRPTLTEPGDGIRAYEEWRVKKVSRLASGAIPQLRIGRITEMDSLPAGVSADVEIVGIDAFIETKASPKRGRKYGDLVHSLLASAEYPPDHAKVEALAAVHELGSRMSPIDRHAIVNVVTGTLAHPLLLAAFSAQRVHREYPVTYEADGELYEGVIDLIWFAGERWTVLDYKTGPGDEPRYRRQIAIYGEAIRKTTHQPVRLLILEIG